MNQIISHQVRWTTSDLELLTTDEWKRYEIIRLEFRLVPGAKLQTFAAIDV